MPEGLAVNQNYGSMPQAPLQNGEAEASQRTAETEAARPLAKPIGAYRHGDLKNALIAAAREMIRRHAGADFTMREIAALTGVRHAAVYRHYPSKEALLDEIVKQECQALSMSIAQADRSASGPAIFEAVTSAYLHFVIERPGEYQVFTRSPKSPGGPQCQIKDALIAPIQRIRDCGALAAQSDPAQLATLLWAQLHGLAVLALSGALTSSAVQEAAQSLTKLWIAKIA